MTINDLVNRAKEVREEKLKEKNTATRVGSLFYDIILFLNGLISGKQDKIDESLITNSKTIPDAINEIMEQLKANGLPEIRLSIHAPSSSANILDNNSITGVALNRNCSAIAIVDKEDESNKIILELVDKKPNDIQEKIDFSQFAGKSVYILACGNNGTVDIDLTLTLKQN